MPADPPILAVAFDLDGLMFNTEDLYDEVIGSLLADRGHAFTPELKRSMMGLPGLRAIAVMCEACDLREPHPLLLDAIHEGMTELLPGRLGKMPGLSDLLQQLDQRRLPRSIATSSSRSFARRCLELSGLAAQFEFVLTAEDVARGKPFPDIYLESADRHGVAPKSMLVLEDSWTGSRAAAAAGARTVAVPGHHSQGQDFSHADLVIDSLASPILSDMIDGHRLN